MYKANKVFPFYERKRQRKVQTKATKTKKKKGNAGIYKIKNINPNLMYNQGSKKIKKMKKKSQCGGAF